MTKLFQIIFVTTVLFSLTNCTALTTPVPLTVYVPSGFTGQIIILYNQKDARQPVFENGRLILQTPDHGIIKTSYDPGKSTSWDIKCFYIDKDNNKKIVKGYNPNYTDEDEDSDTTTVHLIADKTGNFGKDPFQSFYIAKPPLVTPERDKLDSLFRAN